MDLRQRHKADRKQRILKEARAMILAEGMEGLTLRGLAEATALTVPTLYNLFGSREAIIAALVNETMDEMDRRLGPSLAGSTGLERARAIVTTATELLTSDPDVFRPVMLAVEHETLLPRGARREVKALGRNAAMMLQALQWAIEEGTLAGRLDPVLTAHQIFALYRVAMRRWLAREIDDAGFMAHALYGLHLCLLADAAEGSRPALLAATTELEIGMKKRPARAKGA